jgi:alkaline phosphatase
MAKTANLTGYNNGLYIDNFLTGTVRTYSSDSWVTDSAAGATAYSCALKTYNGAIGVDPTGKPCGTLMEAAQAMGMKTGKI